MIPDFTDRSIPQLVSLVDRVAVVTGGSRGTGSGIARRLSEAGAAVVVTDPDLDAAAAGAGALSVSGRRVVGLGLDPTDERSVVVLADQVVAQLGRIDIWVNNAGVYPSTPVTEMSAAQWDEVLDLNLRGAFLGAREAARHMIAAGRGGVIVNIASTSAFRASAPGLAHYVSSKFGLRGLTKALAVELGPHGIRVLGVASTFTATPGTRSRRVDLDDRAYGEYLSAAGAGKPLGRVGVPDDVGRVVLFCASDLAALMTGSTLAVDAGDLAR
ncbi:MAG: SDR family NAD(P)-dependent oxidoreductase [Actinomycetota bacterium]|nr:SDR family NAD(P)-dependent oxidoreductase [Actinomycetota bacterium]